jgi:hypothetical protein
MSGQRFGGGGPRMMYEYANLDWIQDTLVQNQWYIVLGGGNDDLKIYYLIVEQTNFAAANEAIEIEWIIDGNATVQTIAAAVSGQVYYIGWQQSAANFASTNPRQPLSLDFDQSAPLETRSLYMNVRQTSAVDPDAAQIEVNMVYATLEET